MYLHLCVPFVGLSGRLAPQRGVGQFCAMADAGGASLRTKRARRAFQTASDADGACDARCVALAGTGTRPTHAEKQEAIDVIQQMKAAELLAKNARPNPNVVACAIALWRGEPFNSRG